ncbi:UTRA domain-containing protein [Saccharopolyspora shandongensis]|uniref:UTRA domain-containing protein n=1 Tax=Saccharopolyspora shandongensis TaxID=418495 RepID=UPI0033EE9463
MCLTGPLQPRRHGHRRPTPPRRPGPRARHPTRPRQPDLLDVPRAAVHRPLPPAALAAPLLEVDFSRTALYTEYARLCGVQVTAGQVQIRAVVPTCGERQLLGITDTSLITTLVIERLGCSHGQPVESRQTVVRGDRFSFTAEFPSNSGYRLSTAARTLRETARHTRQVAR